MICPKCKKEQHCPCVHCKDKSRGKVVWIWVTGNGPIECGHCGHSMSPGAWEDESYRQYEKTTFS